MALKDSIRKRLINFIIPGWEDQSPGGRKTFQSMQQEILNRLKGNKPSKWSDIASYLQLEDTRNARYADYRIMEEMSAIGATLEVYASEVSQVDRVTKRSAWIEGDAKVVEMGHKLFDRIELNKILPAIARSMAKLGDHFESVRYNPDNPKAGITGIEGVKKPEEVERVDKEGKLFIYLLNGDAAKEYKGTKAFKESPSKKMRETERNKYVDKSQELANAWDYIHFRRLGKHRDTNFGDSVLENARYVYRILKILQESLAVYRATRAPERTVFEIDVGHMPPEQARKHVEMYRREMRQKTHVNKATNAMSIKGHPMAWDTDLYLPIRGNSTNNITSLPGGANISDIVDIDMFRRDLAAALSMPMEYLGIGSENSGVYRPAQLLARQDIRFAHEAKRLQEALIGGLKRMVLIEAALKGLDIKSEDFEVVMIPINPDDERERLEMLDTKINQATLVDTLFTQMQINGSVEAKKFILINVMGMYPEQVKKLKLKATPSGPPESDYGADGGAGFGTPQGEPSIQADPQGTRLGNPSGSSDQGGGSSSPNQQNQSITSGMEDVLTEDIWRSFMPSVMALDESSALPKNLGKGELLDENGKNSRKGV